MIVITAFLQITKHAIFLHLCHLGGGGGGASRLVLYYRTGSEYQNHFSCKFLAIS